MRKRNGFTLIEVILAMAILGIISISFLTILSSHFVFLNKTKIISQEVFLTQREMEMEIDDVKDKIRNKTLTLKDIKIFDKLVSGGISVKYYEVEKTHNNKSFYTLVSNIKPEVLTPIALESIGINGKQGANIVPYGYGTSEFKLFGNYKNDPKYKADHLLNVVEWYVSSKEYITPLPKSTTFNLNDGSVNNLYYYPNFPRDYVLVSNETINEFGSKEREFPLSLDDYKGRHIVFTATPGAKSGKIGTQSVSKPVFISGLPITRNLLTHFDAGFIGSIDTKEVLVNAGKDRVQIWYDISSILGKTMPSDWAKLIFGASTPELMKTEIETGLKFQYVRFGLNNQLEITKSDTSGNNISVFAVVRNNKTLDGTLFLSNGKDKFTIPIEETTEGKKWFLVKKSMNSTSDAFKIGGPNADIAEIVIYKGALTSEETASIEKYLNEKYNSPIPITGQ